jgi:hypothetical protein
MHPTYQFSHSNGYRAQRYRCPLLHPEPTGQVCNHEQFAKGKGCVKDINCELGRQMRITLDRTTPLYKAIYRQCTSAERINSQALALGIEPPKVRNGHSFDSENSADPLWESISFLQRRDRTCCWITDNDVGNHQITIT